MGWTVNATIRPLYPQNDAVPIKQDNGWAPGPVFFETHITAKLPNKTLP